MTPDDADGRLAHLAAAVEDAIPLALRQEWSQRISHEPVLVARQGIFSDHGRPFAYQLSFRSPAQHIAQHARVLPDEPPPVARPAERPLDAGRTDFEYVVLGDRRTLAHVRGPNRDLSPFQGRTGE